MRGRRSNNRTAPHTATKRFDFAVVVHHMLPICFVFDDTVKDVTRFGAVVSSDAHLRSRTIEIGIRGVGRRPPYIHLPSTCGPLTPRDAPYAQPAAAPFVRKVDVCYYLIA